MTNLAPIQSLRSLPLALGLMLLVPQMARGDVIPPEEMACYAKRPGEACRDMPGACQPTKCAKLDYASWDRDASPHDPPSKKVDCILCTDAGAAGSSDAGDAAADADSGGNDAALVGDARASDAALQPDAADAVAAPPAGPVAAPSPVAAASPPPTSQASPPAASSGSEEPEEHDSGCSLSHQALARDLGPWLLAGGVALLVRRRKRAR